MAPFDLSYWHDTTKTYAYFGGFGFFRIFFRQKSDPTMVKSPREMPQLEHLHFHCHTFSGWGTSRGQKLFPKTVFTQSNI